MIAKFCWLLLAVCFLGAGCAATKGERLPSAARSEFPGRVIQGREGLRPNVDAMQAAASRSDGHTRLAYEAALQWYAELGDARDVYAKYGNIVDGGRMYEASWAASAEEVANRIQHLREYRPAVVALKAKYLAFPTELLNYCRERSVPEEFAQKFVAGAQSSGLEDFTKLADRGYETELTMIDEAIETHRLVQENIEWVKFGEDEIELRAGTPKDFVTEYNAHHSALWAAYDENVAIGEQLDAMISSVHGTARRAGE